MSKREHSGVKWSVESWVFYFAAVIDFVLLIIYFSAPIITATINAIRISSLILAVLLGIITFLRQWRSLLYWLKAVSVTAAINIIVDASVFFTIAVLLGLGHRLSFAVAIGIIMLLPPVIIISSIWRNKKPSQVVIGILAFLGFGAGGAFLIYTAPSFNLAYPYFSIWLSAASGGVMGSLSGIVDRLDRHQLGQEIAHGNTENTAPRAG